MRVRAPFSRRAGEGSAKRRLRASRLRPARPRRDYSTTKIPRSVAKPTGSHPTFAYAKATFSRQAGEGAVLPQKILANFSIFDLSKVKGSAIAAEPSAPILISPMRPAWIDVPAAPVALPEAMRAAIIVAL
jgi:hypothetical protein